MIDHTDVLIGLANIAFAWMVQMVGPFLAFPPHILEETIPSYQSTIMVENRMYECMKKEMTLEQQKQYEGLIDKSTVESLEATAYDWGSWIVASGKKALGLAKKVEMVPVPADKIKLSESEISEKWSIPEVEDSFTAMYNVMKSQYRSPGEMKDRSREDGELLKALGDTHEYIHSSVWGRIQLLEKSKGKKSGQMDSKQKEYKPKALEGFVRQQDPTFKSWGYWKDSTKTWIPEWFIIPSNESLEEFDLPEAKGMISDEGKHAWQQVKWMATKNLSGTDKIKKDLVKVYIEATKAKKKMEAAGKEFPFKVPEW